MTKMFFLACLVTAFGVGVYTGQTKQLVVKIVDCVKPVEPT